mmetsp:Transcript_65690/g.186437  ORF Transcript_65690/g.186437 Transcript_65690/m.186437 type:complete len:212 (+) Transcript_65690:2508-3143(+)
MYPDQCIERTLWQYRCACGRKCCPQPALCAVRHRRVAGPIPRSPLEQQHEGLGRDARRGLQQLQGVPRARPCCLCWARIAGADRGDAHRLSEQPVHRRATRAGQQPPQVPQRSVHIPARKEPLHNFRKGLGSGHQALPGQALQQCDHSLLVVHLGKGYHQALKPLTVQVVADLVEDVAKSGHNVLPWDLARGRRNRPEDVPERGPQIRQVC